MDKNTQQPVAWEYFDGTWRIGVDGERENYEMFGYPTRDLYTAPPVPDGYVLVPVEPTPEMMSAGCAVPLNKAARHNAVYRAMIAAAQREGGE